MATRKNTKLRLPQGKVLRFTPTGRAVPVSEQNLADQKLLQAHFPSVSCVFEEPERFGLDKLMGDAARRRFDVVVVWRFDRFARSVSQPTGSFGGLSPSITARYFSSCPSDSTSRWTPCPPETASGGFSPFTVDVRASSFPPNA